MRIFNLLSTVGISTLCLAVTSPALAQDSIPVFQIVNFESNQMQSTLGTYGGTYTDKDERANDTVTYGNSILTTFAFSPNGDSALHPDSTLWVLGRDETGSALRMGYQLGTVRLGCGAPCEYAPHVGFAIGFSSEFDPIELSGATHVSFWAKGRDSLTVNVSLGMRDTVKPAADYSQRFKIDTTWKKYSIELKASDVFKLPDWVTPYPFVAERVNHISFSINKDENLAHPDNALYLDDIEIVNWELSYVSGLFKQGRNAGLTRGLRARLIGDIAHVRLPKALFGKTGVVQALDATGRKIGQAAFGPQAMDVSLSVPGASGKSAGIYFRALTK